MHHWGLSETSECEYGSEVQTYTHILQECPIWKPPCHLTEVDNPLLQNYLQICNFWLELFFFVFFSLFIQMKIVKLSRELFLFTILYYNNRPTQLRAFTPALLQVKLCCLVGWNCLFLCCEWKHGARRNATIHHRTQLGMKTRDRNVAISTTFKK